MLVPLQLAPVQEAVIFHFVFSPKTEEEQISLKRKATMFT